MLMDHLEDSREEDKIMTGVVDFIHNHCKLTQFSKSEIRHVMGNRMLRVITNLSSFFRSY